MRRILFSLIIFFILSANSYSNHLEKALSLNPFCGNNISQENLKEMDNLRIEKIEVDIMKYRRYAIKNIISNEIKLSKLNILFQKIN